MSFPLGQVVSTHGAVDTGADLIALLRRHSYTLWCITEADRSVTTFLLPEEY